MKKSFLAGVALLGTLSTVGLLAHLIMTKYYEKGDTSGDKDSDNSSRPLPEPTPPKRIDPSESHLGIYAQAAVATDAEPCATIGVDILKKNGTAVDAAIATLFCAGAVHPMSLGIGGGFLMTYYNRAEQKSYSLTARETAPAAAHRDMFVNKTNLESVYGGLAIGIPGEVSGYYQAKWKFGNPEISMAELVAPTVKMCQEGITVTRSLVKAFERMKPKTKYITKEWRDIFTDPATREVYKLGDKIKRPQLAKTLFAIGEDSETFYDGDIAKQIVCDLNARGGIITEDDLFNYDVSWAEPVKVRLPSRNLTVHTNPLPSSGAITAAIINIMDHFDLKPADFKDVVTYQRFLEACKFGFAKRTLLGDPTGGEGAEELEKIISELASEHFAQSVRHQIRDDWTSESVRYYGGLFSSPKDAGTSHTSVIAPNGDAVAVTSSVNTLFGSGIISPSTGILFNNHMDDFSTPGLKNAYDIEPSEANMIQPGKRPLSSMSPVIVSNAQGDVELILGAAGGPRIISSTAWVTMMKLYAGKNIKEAIDSPRLHHQLMPMKGVYFSGMNPAIVKYLAAVGHKMEELDVKKRGSIVQGIALESEHIITANYDFRKAGQVDGY